MATRRRKRSNRLGSAEASHKYLARAAEEHFNTSKARFNETLEAGSCLKALKSYAAMENWAGLLRCESASSGDIGEKLDTFLRKQLSELRDAQEQFKFACVVGEGFNTLGAYRTRKGGR